MTEAQEKPNFVVRLIMGSYGVDTPAQAVEGFVNNLVAQGLRDWVYEVIDIETGAVVAELNGYGEDASALLERLREEETAEAGDDDDDDDDDDEDDDDEPSEPVQAQMEAEEDLIKLAENLNAGG